MRQEQAARLLELAVLAIGLVIVILMTCWTGNC